MASFVWGRDPQEAFENPYEYEAQKQFQREASRLLDNLYKLLSSDRHTYTGNDRSVEAAVWLLQTDALDSLFDSLEALQLKRHRVSGKLMRIFEETLDLAAFFSAQSPRSQLLLQKWFDDEVVAHREYRDYIKNTVGDAAAKDMARRYSQLSRFVHRTYGVIMHGYSVGSGERLVHDRIGLAYGESSEADTFMVLPQTMAIYFALLSNQILFFCKEVVCRGCLEKHEVEKALDDCMEDEIVPRRFTPIDWLLPNTPENGDAG